MFRRSASARRLDDSIARARELADGTAPAADLLGFYIELTGYQTSLLARWPGSGRTSNAGSLLGSIDPEWVAGAARDLVSWLGHAAPPALRESAQAMRDVAAEEWRKRFDAYRWSPNDAGDRLDETTIFVLEAVLQPLAERLALERQDEGSGGPRCPVCRGAPVVGVLREEAHGARRALVCGLCLTEWDYRRLVCARCGEERFESLPVFTADQFPHVRIEACDTCRTYLKTIDLTKDGRAVPVVDDIATVSLDLWAREQGYTRLRANLIRI